MKALVDIILFSGFITSPPLRADWHQVSAEVMTTRLELEYWLESQASAKLVAPAVIRRFKAIEAKMSRYLSGSELSKLNRFAASKAIPVSPELYSLLEKSLSVSALSAGAFDMTCASIGRLYDYREKKQPSNEQLTQALPALDYRHVALNKGDSSVRFKASGVVLDLEGLAKGYAVDEGINVLNSMGIKYARLSAGGDMYLLGDKRKKPWLVAIQNPRDKGSNSVVLPLSEEELSTSGDYERIFIDDA